MLDDAERLIAYNEVAPVYASIRQAKAKTGMAEELARRIKEGAIPIISNVGGFMSYYVCA